MNMYSRHLLRMEGRMLFSVLLLFMYYHQTQCDGVVSVWFVEYDNPGGLGDNGNCCDGRWGLCTSACDHMFTICLDDIHSDDQTSSCRYGRVQTGATEDQDSSIFGSHIRDTPNPVVFNISGEIPRTFALKVDVWDKDKVFGVPKNHDHVELLHVDIEPSEQDILSAIETGYVLGSRTSLTTQILVQCSEYYYTATCDVRCAPSSPGQHYICDQTTGEKICQEGWMGKNCELEEETCELGHCSNGGTCIIVNGRAECECPADFSDDTCDTHICDIRCEPGWCIWWDEGYMCQCPAPDYAAVYNEEGMSCEIAPSTTSTTPTTTTTSTTSTSTTTTTTTSLPPSVTLVFDDRDDADCDRLAGSGYRYIDGVYTIHAGDTEPFRVYCDMTHDGAGWTVIQRRRDGSVDFNRPWEDYKQGFGAIELYEEYWIGLENLYHLTNQRSYRLQINMQVGDGTWRYAGYDKFWLEDETNQYRLHAEGFNGNAGNAFNYSAGLIHVGMPFSTRDQDNDQWSDGNCAELYSSGWWFSNCYFANLNGVYVQTTSGWPPCGRDGKCIAWRTIPDFQDFSLSIVEMKVLPNPRF